MSVIVNKRLDNLERLMKEVTKLVDVNDDTKIESLEKKMVDFEKKMINLTKKKTKKD